MVLVGSLTAIGAFSLDMYLPGLPRLAAGFKVDASVAQLTLTGAIIGIAVGQLIAGPVSDVFGRRTPLLTGIGLFVAASVACALVPSVYLLIALRVVQGLGASAGMAIGRAIIRDLYTGNDAARLYSRLMLVVGVSPVLAPSVGSALLRFTSWRGIFALLAILAFALLVACAVSLPETHSHEDRHSGGVTETFRDFHQLLRDRHFVAYALASGLGTGAIFAYLGGSPFVMQNVYHASPQLFGLLFGLNAIGLVVGSQINARYVGRFGSYGLLWVGTAGMVIAGVSLLAVVQFRSLGLVSIVPPLFLLLTSLGFVSSNATALAMADHPRVAGRASALLGLMQFGIGAMVAPFVGIGGSDTALPLAIVILLLVTLSPLQLLMLTRKPLVVAPSSV